MGRERERERLYKEWMEHFCYVDVEFLSRIRRSVVKEAKSMGKKIIISYHNFLRTPTQRKLEQIIREAKKGGAEIVKIATVPKNIRQLRRLLLLPHTIKSVPLAIMPMGKFGEWMRIVCVLMGSVLVYGHVGTPIVEGQPPVEWIKRQLSSLR
jgi:3-dehydroquinate dehydratase-1